MIKYAQNKCLCVFESQRKGLQVIVQLYPFNPRLSMLVFTNAELELSSFISNLCFTINETTEQSDYQPSLLHLSHISLKLEADPQHLLLSDTLPLVNLIQEHHTCIEPRQG